MKKYKCSRPYTRKIDSTKFPYTYEKIGNSWEWECTGNLIPTTKTIWFKDLEPGIYKAEILKQEDIWFYIKDTRI